MSKQWGHGYQTGQDDANKNKNIVVALVAVAAVAIGALIGWFSSKKEDKDER